MRRASFRCLTFCTDELRKRARGLLARTFGDENVAADVEAALFEYQVYCAGSSSHVRSLGLSGKNARKYAHGLRSLRRNLSDRANSLKDDVLSRVILSKDLVRMAPSELASKKLKAERAKQKKMAHDERRISDELRHYKSGSKTDRFLCNRSAPVVPCIDLFTRTILTIQVELLCIAWIASINISISASYHRGTRLNLANSCNKIQNTI